jgi:uncharacterized protein
MPSLPSQPGRASPWYADGLKFTCQQSGHCCTGGPGYVWLTIEEVHRLAEHLRLSADEVIERYCRKIGDRYSLDENRNAQGQYDCTFLAYEQRSESENPSSLTVLHAKSMCRIYPVRPLQCRTWPFWDGPLATKSAWELAAQRCPGMNRGRHHSLEQIESRRQAADWPPEAPTGDKD